MFKGREKELYIILSLPSCYIFVGQKKNMISFFDLQKLYVCDTQVTLFSFLCKFMFAENLTNMQIYRRIQSHCYCLQYCSLIPHIAFSI